jgi:hypothetical protein
MVDVEPGSVEDFFGPVALGSQVYGALATLVDELGPAAVRVSKSQVAFRRRTGFCWVWLPGRYLAHPAAEVVVSMALPGQDLSPRWKESVKVTGSRWMHHLEVHDPAEVDEEVAAWLAVAYEAAG